MSTGFAPLLYRSIPTQKEKPPVIIGGGRTKMKKQQQELKVIVHGELDITKMPKDILDAFIDALIEEVEKMMKEDKLQKS